MKRLMPARNIWLTGLIFGLLGSLPTFVRVHYETLRILPNVLRTLEFSGLPLPDTLAWPLALIRWIGGVSSLAPLFYNALLPVAYLVMALIALRIALPSVHVLRREEEAPLGFISLDAPNLLRLVGLVVAWLAVVLFARAWLRSPGEVMLLSVIACMLAALLWSEDGIGGWICKVSRGFRGWGLLRLVGAGAACGLLGGLALQFASYDFGAALYRFMFNMPAVAPDPAAEQALADLNPRGWLVFAGASVVIAFTGGFCWASLWTATVAPMPSYSVRARALAAALIPLALVMIVGVWMFYGVVVRRMDYKRSLQEFALREQIPFGQAGLDTVLVPASDGNTRVVRIPFRTVVGFPNEPGVTYKVEQYLKQRRYQTTLSRVLFIHLYDVRCIDWDPVRSLEVDRLCIEKAPRLQFVQLMVETLSHCAVTPEAKRYLEWLDSRVRRSRQSQRACQVMGHLYARFGDEHKAQEWYRRGRIPPENWRKPAPLGVIIGKIEWSGMPPGAVRVGVISQAALPPPLRPSVTPNQRVLTLPPFLWRNVSVVVGTDENGRFRTPPLPYGNYVLLLRAETRYLPAVPSSAKVETFPPEFRLDARTKDVGVIRIRPNLSAPRPQRPDMTL